MLRPSTSLLLYTCSATKRCT